MIETMLTSNLSVASTLPTHATRMGNFSSKQVPKAARARLPSVIRRLGKSSTTVGSVLTSISTPEPLAATPPAETFTQAADAADEHVRLELPDDCSETLASHT
ncbi:uncharacterized protein RCC_04058 [Ramularia collo-cygni]|uniref:Uncharacterized protein n=1 Tax=Ramularia collo-cygni TaxID=112498 RepID=A0A2D3V6Q3_9PEZI|nr:uncharacterized protein RCC_04058 [Ramularia collo-cygni]CZT18214.1 uncharacterized protein RCC_04058 [Ramularia collo-cygni]